MKPSSWLQELVALQFMKEQPVQITAINCACGVRHPKAPTTVGITNNRGVEVYSFNKYVKVTK
jgi:hypothetical protein